MDWADAHRDLIVGTCGVLCILLGFILLWAIWQVHRPFYRTRKKTTTRVAKPIRNQANQVSGSIPRRQSSRR